MGEFTLKGLQNRSLAARVVRGGIDFHALPPSPFTRGRQVPGTPPSEQLREARYRMLGLQFKDYEKEIRQHLSGMLPKDLFEFGEDVESITINRGPMAMRGGALLFMIPTCTIWQ